MSLRQKTLSGLAWSGVDSLSSNFLRFVIMIFLARLLNPEDFGLIAVLGIFISLSDTIINGGLGSSLIRQKSVSEQDYSTVFIYNLCLSLLLYVAIFLLSPLIAVFFKKPQLELLSKVISLVFVFHALGIVQLINLKRTINFKKIAQVNIISTLMAGSIAILMAYRGFGVWSLAIQLLLKASISTIMLWIFGVGKFSLRFSKASFKDNFKFGYNIVIADIINSIAYESYNFLIGKFYSIKSLGYFYQGSRISRMPSGILANVFQSVSYPALSSIQEEQERLNRAYTQFIRTVSFVSFPLMFLLIVVAKPLFILVFSEKWIDSIIFFQIISFGGSVMPIITISGNIPLIKGRSDIYMKLGIYYNILLITLLIISSFFGMKAMAISLTVQLFIQLIVNKIIISKYLGLSVLKQFLAMKDAFIISLILSFAVYALKYVISSNLLLLLIQCPSFCVLYFFVSYHRKCEEIIIIKNLLINKFARLN